MSTKYYITTPIYYVNDRPHLGHLYTTTLADIVARFHRLRGDDVFFLTGVDEHAAKVEKAARAHGRSPRAWADEHAANFRDALDAFGISNDDFVRTSEQRHTAKVTEYVSRLIERGDVYQGQFEGWYDETQEEYLTDRRAAELQHQSPYTRRPLVRRREASYFFRLSRYQERLVQIISSEVLQVRPDARRTEVLARLHDGLEDVPISRSGGGWGIPVPGDATQTIYVWIDALFNYLSYVDTEDRRRYWPADVHIIGKDILWFHAVIWPALLLALDRPIFGLLYVHSLWLRDGQKMSKSLGNVIDQDALQRYLGRFSLDGARWFLATRGPLGSADSDFSDAPIAAAYNADLANAFGNCASRVLTMLVLYFDGRVPIPAASASGPLIEAARRESTAVVESYAELRVDQACRQALELVRAIDREIDRRRPFVLAREPSSRGELADVLYTCVEALRIATVLLWPVVPSAAEELWQRLNCSAYSDALREHGRGRLDEWIRWGALQPSTVVRDGPPLFPRVTV